MCDSGQYLCVPGYLSLDVAVGHGLANRTYRYPRPMASKLARRPQSVSVALYAIWKQWNDAPVTCELLASRSTRRIETVPRTASSSAKHVVQSLIFEHRSNAPRLTSLSVV